MQPSHTHADNILCPATASCIFFSLSFSLSLSHTRTYHILKICQNIYFEHFIDYIYLILTLLHFQVYFLKTTTKILHFWKKKKDPKYQISIKITPSVKFQKATFAFYICNFAHATIYTHKLDSYYWMLKLYHLFLQTIVHTNIWMQNLCPGYGLSETLSLRLLSEISEKGDSSLYRNDS